MRIGQNVNPHLGGTRLGPYTVLAKPKGSTGPFVFEVTVTTEAEPLDGAGKPVPLAKARSIKEKFVSVALAPNRP